VKRLVKFTLEQGGSVLVKIDEPPAGPVMRGLRKERPSVAEQTGRTFEEATATATRAAVNPVAPLGVEFGLQLSTRTGAFIASVAAQDRFRISMIWRRCGAASG
jgi:hypothetical protein